jgi:outer membrane protein TolC
MPKAERTLELIETAYERGQADYLRLLDAQQVVVESRVSYVDALRRLHEAAALLRELAQSDAPWREAREAGNVDGEVTP